jgi:hypothetical protein
MGRPDEKQYIIVHYSVIRVTLGSQCQHLTIFGDRNFDGKCSK